MDFEEKLFQKLEAIEKKLNTTVSINPLLTINIDEKVIEKIILALNLNNNKI